MAGDIKKKYGTQLTLTVTNLHSLASSQDWLTGWGSATIDNTSVLATDYLVSGVFATHASNRQAGQLSVYVIGCTSDSPTYPAVASGTAGTEGAISFTDSEERDSSVDLVDTIILDNSASSVVNLRPRSIAQIFGELPPYFFLYVAQNASTTTTAGLASSGSALYLKPILYQYT